MDHIVYPFRRTNMHVLYFIAGILVLIAGLPFLCISALVGGSIVKGLQSGELGELLSTGDGWLASLGISAVCAAGPVLYLLSGLIIYLASISYEAVLTSETFSFGPRGRLKTIRLSEITNVSLFSSWYKLVPNFPWKVIIKDSQGQQIQLPITRWAWLKFSNNIFDYKTMLGDLLQRVPATATVDDSVKNFSTTGVFPEASPWLR